MRRAVKRYTVLLEFLIALGILPGRVWSVPTVCVTHWWVGAWTHRGNGKNPKPDKGSKNAARTHRQLHAVLARFFEAAMYTLMQLNLIIP